VAVAPPPAAVEEVRRRYAIPGRRVRHVEALEPLKDGGTIAEACRRLDVPLVLTGQPLRGTLVL